MITITKDANVYTDRIYGDPAVMRTLPGGTNNEQIESDCGIC